MSRHPRLLLLPLAFVLPLATYLPVMLGAPDMGDRATANGVPPELPPGLFFSIWAVIYAAFCSFALHAWRNDSALSSTLSAPLAASGAIAGLWVIVQQTLGQPILDLILLAPFIWFTWQAAFRLDQMDGQDGSVIEQTANLLTGLLAGWATVALAISTPRAARQILNQGPTDSEWVAFLSALLVIAIATYIFRTRISRTIWYYLAAVWGLAGILVNNWTRTGFGYFGWITLFFGLWLIYRRLTRGANGSTRPA